MTTANVCGHISLTKFPVRANLYTYFYTLGGTLILKYGGDTRGRHQGDIS